MNDALITRGDLPYFEVHSIKEETPVPATEEHPELATWHIRGIVSDPRILKMDTWCTLLGPNRNCLTGNWLDARGTRGEVVFDTASRPEGIDSGTRLPYAGQLYARIAILVEDGPSAWRQQVFRSANALATRLVGTDGQVWRKLERYKEGTALASDAQLVEDGWNHEHCGLCNAHIDPGDKYFGHDLEDEYLCVECYYKHVPSGDLGFLAMASNESEAKN